MPLDWRNWKFCEKSFTDGSCSLEGLFSSNFEGPAESLCFDKFPSLSCPSGTSLLKDKVFLDQWGFRQETLHEAPAMVSAVSSDAQVTCCQLVKGTEMVCITTPKK